MSAIDEVKARLSIEDVVGEYVQLKRAGRNWKGLSPFTSERTPSLMVSPEKQIWHDFSSSKGGNMFSFVMEMEGLDFKGALELLARKAGVDLEQYRGESARKGPNRARLHELLELSTKFYQTQFSQNKMALEYVLKKRAFTKETALAWRLGYAPNGGTALIDFLKARGFSEAEMRQAGVVAQRARGLGDMFRGRLMIPLQDPFGAVIGFTARLLDDGSSDGSAPKYINTPQTVLYDKSRHVYGLHFAKEAIRKGQFAVIAEGNLDVIASHQAGVRQVVATAGTALTEHQLKALSRFTGDIRLSFDADRAGLAATERAIPIASKVGVSLSIINIPSGKDPDELIRQDAKLWKAAITQHQYALDWLMVRYATILDITSAEGKRRFSDVLLPVVRSLRDSVEQDHYLSVIAKTIDVSRDALDAKLAMVAHAAMAPLRKPKLAPAPISDKDVLEMIRQQERFLALVLLRPELRTYLDVLTPDMLTKQPSRQLLQFLRDNPDFDGGASYIKKLQNLPADEAGMVQNLGDYVKILALQYEELYQGLELTELEYEAARLQARLIEMYVKQQKRILAVRLETADEDQMASLLEQVRRLDLLLKQVKGGSLPHA